MPISPNVPQKGIFGIDGARFL